MRHHLDLTGRPPVRQRFGAVLVLLLLVRGVVAASASLLVDQVRERHGGQERHHVLIEPTRDGEGHCLLQLGERQLRAAAVERVGLPEIVRRRVDPEQAAGVLEDARDSDHVVAVRQTPVVVHRGPAVRGDQGRDVRGVAREREDAADRRGHGNDVHGDDLQRRIAVDERGGLICVQGRVLEAREHRGSPGRVRHRHGRVRTGSHDRRALAEGDSGSDRAVAVEQVDFRELSVRLVERAQDQTDSPLERRFGSRRASRRVVGQHVAHRDGRASHGRVRHLHGDDGVEGRSVQTPRRRRGKSDEDRLVELQTFAAGLVNEFDAVVPVEDVTLRDEVHDLLAVARLLPPGFLSWLLPIARKVGVHLHLAVSGVLGRIIFRFRGFTFYSLRCADVLPSALPRNFPLGDVSRFYPI